MCVSFVARTHMFFTGGKDRLLKEWDGDNFEHIQTLKFAVLDGRSVLVHIYV